MLLSHLVEAGAEHLSFPPKPRIPFKRATRIVELLQPARCDLKLNLADQFARQERRAGELLIPGHRFDVASMQAEQADECEGNHRQSTHHLEEGEASAVDVLPARSTQPAIRQIPHRGTQPPC